MASLRRLLAELQQTQPETEAELTQLQARLAALEAALKTSQDACEGLRKSVALKDNTIKVSGEVGNRLTCLQRCSDLFSVCSVHHKHVYVQCR